MAKGHRNLRAYRESKGLSPTEFAKQLGINVNTLRSYENGNRAIPAELAREVEIRTGGAITRRKLLPELFGPVEAA